MLCRPAFAPETRHVLARRGRVLLAHVVSGERGRVRQDFGHCALGDDLAAAVARRRTEIDQVVGAENDGAVVLDDEHRVAAPREIAQQREKSLVVLRMQSDGRLVEHIKRRSQSRAERRCEVDALGLAARERARLAIERQVVQADPVQHREPLAHLVEEMAADRERARFGAAQRRTRPKILDRQREKLRQGPALEADGQRLVVQPAACRQSGQVL